MRINAAPGRAGLWLANSPSHQSLRGAGEDMHDRNEVASALVKSFLTKEEPLLSAGGFNLFGQFRRSAEIHIDGLTRVL
jgi:hypothetical protein